MFRSSTSIFSAGLFFFSICAHGQAVNACDLNQDGLVNAVDVQAAINMALGISPCTANIAGANVCNIVIVQRVVNASLSGTCLTSIGLHSVLLNWSASGSSNVVAYKVYRGLVSGGPYTSVSTLGNVTSYVDTTVLSGQTYYYVITALDNNNNESAYSIESKAVISTP